MSWAVAAEPPWAPALRAWAMVRLGKPFAWGETDCAILACEAVDVQTSGRLAERYRGRYGTLLGALRLQIKEGINLASVLADAGLREIPAGEAMIGDLICVPDGPLECGHVVFGPRSLGVWPEGRVGWCWTWGAAGMPGAVGYTLRPAVR